MESMTVARNARAIDVVLPALEKVPLMTHKTSNPPIQDPNRQRDNQATKTFSCSKHSTFETLDIC